MNLEVLLKKAVEEGEIPRYLYKFREIDVEGHTENIFANSQLWFSKPSDFNDPFDCQIGIEIENTKEAISMVLQKFSTTKTRAEINKKVKHYSKNKAEYSQLVKTTISSFINAQAICCFAGDENSKSNILMWSHYAKSHQGICLKFDVLKDTEFFSKALKVNYQKEYPKCNYAKNSDFFVENLITTKAKIWEYEEEVRILRDYSALYTFKNEALVEVCFGCNCSKENIRKVKKLIIEKKINHLEFTKAKISKSKYELKFERL